MDLLAAWNQRTEPERRTLLAALVELVAAKLIEDTAPWYPGAVQDEPRVEVYAASETAGRLTVHFVADHLIYCYAQSGSDWADHHVFVGEAVFEADRRVAGSVILAEHTYLSEQQEASFDKNATVATVRDAAIARLAPR